MISICSKEIDKTDDNLGLFYAFRSLAYFKVGNYQSALEDADIGLELKDWHSYNDDKNFLIDIRNESRQILNSQRNNNYNNGISNNSNSGSSVDWGGVAKVGLGLLGGFVQGWMQAKAEDEEY